MRKNWFGMLLVLGISLAPLYGASADSSDSAPCASEISVRKDWFKLTGDMAAIHGAMPNGICPGSEAGDSGCDGGNSRS